jgi:hypothetical protein
LFFESKVDGEPLLLLQGMTGSHEDWEYAGRQEFLCKYRLITHDARGHGRSAMVVVSATMYFPEQARAIMQAFPVEDQPESEWETMRRRHKHGDAQIVALWEQCLALKYSWSEKLTALARQGAERGARLSQGARVTYLGVTTPTLSTPLQAM